MVQEEVIIKFEGEVDDLEESVDRLINVTSKLQNSSKNISNAYDQVTNKMKKSNNAIKETSEKIKNSTNQTTTSLVSLGAILGTASKKIQEWTAESADFIGIQTRFNATFNTTTEELKEAQRWVDEYSNALFLDSKEVMNAASTFKILTSNMGINNEQSTKMSKNLTQLAYDLKAVKGVDINQAMTDLRAGMSGQAEGLQKYGIQLNQATLQTRLYELGIDRTVASLNSAERAQIIYYQIMKTSAGMQGYYAKTLMSPANALNIVKTQFTLLAREIGNVFIPILTALVPFVILLTNALRALAKALASLFGLEIDFSDYGKDIGNISGGIDGIGESADGASKKMKNMLRDFDELHVVNFDEPSGSGSGAGLGGAGFEIPDFEYDDYNKYLGEIQEKIETLYNKIKPFIPLFIAIALAIAGIKIVDLIKNIGNFLLTLSKTHPIATFIIALGGLATGCWLFEDGIKSLIDGNYSVGTFAKILGGLAISIAAVALALVVLTKGTIVAQSGLLLLFKASFLIVGIVFTLASFVWGVTEAFNDWSGASNGLTIATFALAAALGILLIAGAPIVALVLGIIGGIVLLIAQIREFAINMGWLKGEVKKETEETGNLFDKLFDSVKNKLTGTTTNVSSYTDELTNSMSNTGKEAGNLQQQLEQLYGKDTAEMLQSSLGNYEQFGNGVTGITSEMTSLTTEDLNKLNDEFNSTTEDILTTGTQSFSDLALNIETSMEDAFLAFNNSMQDILDRLDADVIIIQEYVNEIKKSLRSIGETQIKIPHFRIDWDTWSTNGQFMQKAGLPGFPMIGVDWYMNGGFPTKGDLFIANEREPELIGSMGNRSVVANNTQITEGIADASYYGMRKALKEVDFGGDTEIYIGNRQITDYVVKQKKMDDRRYGR